MTVTETTTAFGRRLEWQLAEVRDIVIETPRVRSLCCISMIGLAIFPVNMWTSG